YKKEPAVAGYDVLNETVLGAPEKLNRFYRQAIQRIREVDPRHMIFVEGNNWAQDLACLDVFDDDNYALSIHNYEPLDFTFNFVPFLRYPLRHPQKPWNKTILTANLQRYARISAERKVPIFVGEFGINAREGIYGEDLWLKDTLTAYEKFGFHWTYWTYKAIKNFTFPDGLYSYRDNPQWVHREGPVTGWDTYHRLWTESQRKMAASWRTAAFVPNEPLINVIKKYGR
ncbi:MAG: glycoside hydrolase family 5 protein, partial [Candidatus Omnitrophica bacterium]|nr:glycoside hydrolase family 5 protein [Candidatus Omnitrophota bacterium]